MLATDLAAEWQRVETDDSPEHFIDAHGGKEKVLADPELKRAYERRVTIREKFLDLMREGYKRHNQSPPFDRGEKAERAGTITRNVARSSLILAALPPVAGAERHWPRFRGPTGQGLTGKKQLPIHWDPDGSNVMWRVKVPHAGNSSPIIWGDRIFLTGAEPDGKRRFV
jgi:hypothetical protein